jgi:hypothetical protein
MLTIDDVEDFNEKSMNNLLLNCKHLKTLHLRNCSFQTLDITESNVLENLTLSLSGFTKLKIDSQTLKSVSIYDNEFLNVPQLNCENLKDLIFHSCILTDELVSQTIEELKIKKLSLNECSGLFNLKISLEFLEGK